MLMKKFQLIQSLKGHTKEVRDIAISPDGKTIVSAGSDNTARVWEANETDKAKNKRFSLKKVLQDHENIVWTADFRFVNTERAKRYESAPLRVK